MKTRTFVFVFVLFFLFATITAASQTVQTTPKRPTLQLRRLPDLQVSFTCPSTIAAGTDIGSQVKLKVWNSGKAAAKGTDTAGRNGYMVDLMLSTDTTVPAGWAIYSPSFSEDVLLKGGRVSNTKTLNPGQGKYYPVGAGIPADTPPGAYYICAKVDAGNKIAELNENNNSFCKRVYIKKGEGQRLPDLQVSLNCPTNIAAGTDIGPSTKIKVWNSGAAPAAGTDTAGSSGYMVDLMLSTDTTVPAGWAIYSPSFSEDVLLKGGRVSNTKTLNPGQSEIYGVGGGIPADTPPGAYYICAKVDAGNKITESNEGNNSFCKSVEISNPQAKADLWVEIRVSNISAPYPNARFDFIVHNTGAAPSVQCDMSVWLYKGSTPSGTHNMFWGYDGTSNPRVPAIPVGGTHTKTENYVLNFPGDWTLKAEVDPHYMGGSGNVVDESNEGNNITITTFAVSGAGGGTDQ